MINIKQIRRIVKLNQIEQVGECWVDVQSASALLTMHDALNEENRKKLLSMHITDAVAMSWRCLKRSKE